jgi:hypothetical protein
MLVVNTFTFRFLVTSYVIAFSEDSFGATILRVCNQVVIKSATSWFFRADTRVMQIRNIIRGYTFVVGAIPKVTHGVLTQLWRK